MPWNNVTPMEEIIRFVSLAQTDRFTLTVPKEYRHDPLVLTDYHAEARSSRRKAKISDYGILSVYSAPLRDNLGFLMLSAFRIDQAGRLTLRRKDFGTVGRMKHTSRLSRGGAEFAEKDKDP